MLWTIIVILGVLWLLGMVSSYAAVIMLLFDLLRGRRAFS
jgi:hypothetical protein